MNAEEIQITINANLAQATSAPLRVVWDGGIVDRENPPRFDVVYDDEETNFHVIDGARYARLIEFDGGLTNEINCAANYDSLAELIAEVVPSAIAS